MTDDIGVNYIVTFIGATGLSSLDLDGKSDPYVVGDFPDAFKKVMRNKHSDFGQPLKTEPVFNTRNPVWNFEWRFKLDESKWRHWRSQLYPAEIRFDIMNKSADVFLPLFSIYFFKFCFFFLAFL